MRKREVWKYELSRTILNRVLMPQGAQIIHIGSQGDVVMIWAMVDPSAPKVTRCFQTIGTGSWWDEDRWVYRGTVQMEPFVWHVIEQRKEEG